MKFTDDSTIRVLEWIKRLGGKALRINVEDIPNMAFGTSPEGGSFFVQDGRKVFLNSIRTVWFRRAAPVQLPDISVIPDPEVRKVTERHMRSEMKGAVQSFYDSLSHAFWLSHPDTAAPPKFSVLQKAKAAGLDIPPTLITNDKATLNAFRRQHGDIIIKCITDADFFQRDHIPYGLYTKVFTPEHIDSLPDTFFPVLVQKKIEKAWELRIFYLGGACYPMAIFSQGNQQTEVDFRNYDFENPNRNVFYNLGPDLERRIGDLMDTVSLNTGSLDMIRGTDGKSYFLEVNPVGMFGMVSFPCNLNLRKKVAEFLIDKDRR
ncbi:MAG: grasp-with-spasm system ATP-grasp peptide maturase [Acidobacteriota bacterium]|nr:grasp-with-spasm system ATP-grasp peptide maturase [Acidobacteriota bacterium]